MTRVLLDTSAYSVFMRGQAAINQPLQHADEIYVSPIVLGELLAGFRRGRNRARNERELQTFLSSPRVRGVGLDEETAERYAVIVEGLWKAGTPIPTNDIWIAASAMQYGLSIVTTDAHYQRAAQVIVHLFEPS